MNTPHTPGPWTAYVPSKQRPLTAKGNPSDKRLMVLHPDGQRLIACLNTGYVSSKGEIPEQEREANAILIAAAPCLLAALERLSKAIDDYDGNIPADIESPYHQARAAILKATTTPQ